MAIFAPCGNGGGGWGGRRLACGGAAGAARPGAGWRGGLGEPGAALSTTASDAATTTLLIANIPFVDGWKPMILHQIRGATTGEHDTDRSAADESRAS